MPIPAALRFGNEAAFTERFVVPLLGRLGFGLVVNYHGHAEFGKDLVFAEVDRFGHVRYHACQVKYQQSISLNGVEDLIRDARQSFSNPFSHPQTGASERISGFYVATAGSVSQEASRHFFNSLCSVYGDNIRLLQAKDLVVLDQSAIAARRDSVLERLTGMQVELRFNRAQIKAAGAAYRKALDKGSQAQFYNILRLDAVSRYLAAPMLAEDALLEAAEGYWRAASIIQQWMSVSNFRGINVKGQEDASWGLYLKLNETLEVWAVRTEAAVTETLERLQPLGASA